MTIRAIARELGVSSAAVSLGLRNSPRVSAELRAKIVAAAKVAGYIPNVRVAELMGEIRKSRQPTYRATLGAFSLYPAEKPWADRPYLKEMLDAAIETAAGHGYRLEYFWLKRPGLSPQRFCSILQARGINGLFCLGSLEPEEKMPAPLSRFAVVSQGPSIAGNLHRVLSNFAGDTRQLMSELLRRGYRRPGLVLVPSGDLRSNYTYSSTFLGFQERQLTAAPAVPILRAETWSADEFQSWFEAHRPDVLVLHQHIPYIDAVDRHLAERRIKVPGDVGIALLNTTAPGDVYHAGIFQQGRLCGSIAIEMLMGRVHLRDFGEVVTPKVELVAGRWREGRSLRRAR